MERAYDESGEVASFALVTTGDPGLPHELVDEWVNDRRGDRLGELEVKQDEEL